MRQIPSRSKFASDDFFDTFNASNLMLRNKKKRCRENNHEHATMTMMTRAEIRKELGWSDEMIHSLLQIPDSTNGRSDKYTGAYTYGLYRRDRMLDAAQSSEGKAAKKQCDETLRGDTPNPGWTIRLGDIGRALGITAVAAGKILERLAG